MILSCLVDQNGRLDISNNKICPLFQILYIETPDFSNLLCCSSISIGSSKSTKHVFIGLDGKGTREIILI